GTVLEIASGTGEHALYFAGRFPALRWQPTDPDAEARASIAGWRERSGLTNLRPPLALNAADEVVLWPCASSAAVLCINMIHISPWASAEGLFKGAAVLLP